jgi:hypothetical protein
VIVYPISQYEHEIFAKDVVSGFRVMTIEGVEYLWSEDHTSWGDTIIIEEYEFDNSYQYTNNLPISFTITVPSAGTLVMSCKYDGDYFA